MDLNPIRGHVRHPETSDHTSIQECIRTVLAGDAEQPSYTCCPSPEIPEKTCPRGLSFRLEDYLEPVDWTRTILRDVNARRHPRPLAAHSGAPTHVLALLAAHGQAFKSSFKGLVGAARKLKATSASRGYRRPQPRRLPQVSDLAFPTTRSPIRQSLGAAIPLALPSRYFEQPNTLNTSTFD